MLVRNLGGEADWDLTNFTGGTDLGNRVSIHIHYWHLRKACSVVSKSIPVSVLELYSLAIRGLEAMSRASIL